MKRGNIYFWFAAAVALMAIAGCTKTVHTPENGRHSIGFNVQEPVKSAVTGAADITSFAVWGWYGSTERNKNVFDGIQVHNTGSDWVYDNIQYWVPDMNYIFYAVYPFGVGECSADGTFTVKDFNCSAFGDNAVDLMTAGAVEGNGNNPANVAFNFVHELSKLKFRFESSQTAVTITDIKLYGISAGGTLKKASGGNASWNMWSAVTADDPTYSVTEAVVLNTENSYAAEPYGELLLPPHTALTDAKLSFSYYYNWETPENAHKAELQLAAGSTTITSWEAGKSYNYTVKIPATNDIKLIVTVAGWDTQDTSVSWTPGN